jgi:hypothetical protein
LKAVCFHDFDNGRDETIALVANWGAAVKVSSFREIDTDPENVVGVDLSFSLMSPPPPNVGRGRTTSEQ